MVCILIIAVKIQHRHDKACMYIYIYIHTFSAKNKRQAYPVHNGGSTPWRVAQTEGRRRLEISLLPYCTNAFPRLMIHPTALDAARCVAANELNASLSSSVVGPIEGLLNGI